ncbi:hypothetical protein RYX36_022972 [Vicia faba]
MTNRSWMDLFPEAFRDSPETGNGKQPAIMDEDDVEDGGVVGVECSLDEAAVTGGENGSSHDEAEGVPKYSWKWGFGLVLYQ